MIKEKLNFVITALIVILEIIGFCIAITENGFSIFGYYTQDSNLLLLIACLLYLSAYLRNKGNISYKIKTFRYIAVCLVTVTLCVVVFCFIPMLLPYESFGAAAYDMLIKKANLFHHFACPVLAIFSFLYLGDSNELSIKESLLAAIPTLLYAIITVILNIAKVIKGPYPFLYVYEQPVLVSVLWFIVIPLAGWLFALLLLKIKKFINK